jgi:putative endonuclease
LDKLFYTYIVTNKPHGTLYTGHTDDLNKRAWQHREHILKGSFSDNYNLETLVWYEAFDTRDEAIGRERQIKDWKRDWKIELIETLNPDWRDLADRLL